MHRTKGGPRQPLRDLWAASISRLATQTSLEDYHGAATAEPPDGKAYCLRQSAQTMLVEDHVLIAALEFANHLTPRDPEGNILIQLATDIDGSTEGLEAKRRSQVYWCSIQNGWDYEHRGEAPGSLPNKLKRWTSDREATNNLLLHWAHFKSSVPDHMIFFFLRLVHNALPTERRRQAMRSPVPQRSDTGANPCFLCYTKPDEPKHTDSIEHIFGPCPTVERARALFHTSLALPPPNSSISSSLLLDPFGNAKLTNATLSFNFSTYSHSRSFFASATSALPIETAARRLARTAITDWASHCSKKWRPNTLLLTNTLPTLFNSPPARAFPLPCDVSRERGLGSAGNRTPHQQNKCRDYAAQAMARVPDNAIVAYTDGSASPNPGPCGAGAYIHTKGAINYEAEAFASLGHGTNNIGELWAIGMCVQLAIRATNEHPAITAIHAFTDSRLIRDFIRRKATPKSNSLSTLLLAVMNIISTIPTHVPFQIHWIPAHVGIPGNEHADYLADIGSKASTRNSINVNRLTGAATLNFLPNTHN